MPPNDSVLPTRQGDDRHAVFPDGAKRLCNLFDKTEASPCACAHAQWRAHSGPRNRGKRWARHHPRPKRPHLRFRRLAHVVSRWRGELYSESLSPRFKFVRTGSPYPRRHEVCHYNGGFRTSRFLLASNVNASAVVTPAARLRRFAHNDIWIMRRALPAMLGSCHYAPPDDRRPRFTRHAPAPTHQSTAPPDPSPPGCSSPRTTPHTHLRATRSRPAWYSESSGGPAPAAAAAFSRVLTT